MLESLRGLAALAVALFHSFHVLSVDGNLVYDRTIWNAPSPDGLMMRLIMVLFNGGAAVSLFFVLSGFVLMLSLHRDGRPFLPKAWAFSRRRFFRIYPPLAINIGVFAIIIIVIAKSLPIVPVTTFQPAQIITNLLLEDYPVNGATWSLMIEIVAIPFVFIGYIIARRWGLLGCCALVLIGLIMLFAPILVFRKLIGQFVFMFFLGMLVAELRLNNLPLKGRTAKIWLVAAVVSLLSARFVISYSSKWALVVEGVASAALIAALVLGPRSAVHNLLELEPFRFLGRISYSFYLYHPLAFGIFIPLLTIWASPSWLQAHPFLGSVAIAAVTTIATIPLGYASYMLTEKPMMRLGR